MPPLSAIDDPSSAAPPGAALRERLGHVRWIGGGGDAGKTRLARHLSRRLGWPVYHYDAAAPRHHRRLAETSSLYAALLAESADAAWVWPEPTGLAERALQAFRDRFPFVVEDLTALSFPPGLPVLAEGVGLLPDLVAPVLAQPRHAVFLLPTSGFRQAAMAARGEGGFASAVSDPARAALNRLERDRQLADHIRAGAAGGGLPVVEVAGFEDVDALARRLEEAFSAESARGRRDGRGG